MAKYRKKPVVVEAVKWHEGDVHEGVSDRANLSELWFDKTSHDGRFFIATLEGEMKVTNGDYIIKGIKGEFYPCKPDIFEQTYELVG